MKIPEFYILGLSSLLLVIALTGLILHRKNIIVLLMCVELILLAANTQFIAYGGLGDVFVFFVLAVAAAEAAIGLALVVLLFRKTGCIDVDSLRRLQG